MNYDLTPIDQPPVQTHRPGILIVVWLICAIGLGLVVWEPLGSRTLRAATVLFSVALVLIGFALTPRMRTLRWGIAFVLTLAVAALALPVRSTDPTALRATYVAALQRFAGTPYLLGGENARGIDCSGLVRRAMVDALIDQGVWGCDPGLIRRALWLWWKDRSADDLGNGVDGWCRPVLDASTVNTVERGKVQPGDLAVVAGGLHMLAYLGDGRWISADPDELAVVIDQAPSKKGWFRTKTHVVRWVTLDERAPLVTTQP